MRRIWLSMLLVGLTVMPLTAAADKASDDAFEARIKALELRIAALEARITAAPPPPVPGQAASASAISSVPIAPAAPPRWQDNSNWSGMKAGLGWSQVKAMLGPAGKVSTGVFGDVWYYPDDSGGRVVFDRDGRVSEWNAPPGR